MSLNIRRMFGQEAAAEKKVDSIKLSYGSKLEEEEEKVGLMRTLVEEKDPASKEENNLMLRRFLRARNLDIEKASDLFLKYLKWKRIALPNGFISESEIRNELSQKKSYMQGFDKAGQLIFIAFIGKHIYANRSMDEFKRYIVYILEKICSSMPDGKEKFTWIADLKDWGYSNCDIRAYITALDILQNRYPERLGKAMFINVPRIFMKAWNAVYPFIDENTRKKIFFVDDKNLTATLLEEIDESQLPDVYGGKLSLVPIDES